MELTIADIRSIGYRRKDKEIYKKITPWLWVLLGILIVCIIVLAISTTDVPPVTYTTPDGDEVIIALDYATFNGQIMSKEVEPSIFSIVYVSGTMGVLSVVALLGLMIYAMIQAEKAGTQFIGERLKEKGITDLS